MREGASLAASAFCVQPDLEGESLRGASGREAESVERVNSLGRPTEDTRWLGRLAVRGMDEDSESEVEE